MFQSLSFSVLLARVLVLCTAIPLHEFAHAWAADKMGDPTGRYHRRITLNPLDHIDPVGALMILFLGVGFARPVSVNAGNFHDRKKGMIITSLAGPASNILAALICLTLYKLLIVPFVLIGMNSIMMFLLEVLTYMVFINISLAVLNLLPIPPLDGWNALSQVLPPRIQWQVAMYERQLVLIVLVLLVMGAFTPIISTLADLVFFVIDKLTFFLDLLRIVVL